MRILHTSSDHTVRPPRGWKERAWTLGLVFALAAVAVFLGGWAARGLGQPAVETGATAAVSIELDPGDGDDGSAVGVLAEAPWSWIQGIRQEVTSDANLVAAVRELGIAVPADEGSSREELIERSVGQIRRGLEVKVVPSSGPEATRVRFDYRGPTPGYSALVVNRLATGFADSLRTSWKARAHRAYAEARAELQRAQDASRRAAAAVEVFLEESLRKPAAASATTEEPLSVPAQRAQPPASRTVENPDWTAVFAQLQDLKRRRAELLVTRTELHPLVQDAAYRIEALERQLAAIPRDIVVPVPEESAPVPGGPAQDAAAPGSQGPAQGADPADVEALARLKAAAEDASERCRLAALAERAAWSRCQQEPQVELEPAELRQPASTEGVGLGWLLVSLAAGLATAAGVGLTATGAAMERPLDSIERIEAVSGGPVVAVIPRREKGDRSNLCEAPFGPSRQIGPVPFFPLLRASLILGGAVLVVGCAGLVVRALV